MDYFNDHASFYPTSSAREEFNDYQLPGQTSATEETNYLDSWNASEQPGPTVGSLTGPPATAGYGKHCCKLSS
jgi:hypothetical protein